MLSSPCCRSWSRSASASRPAAHGLREPSVLSTCSCRPAVEREPRDLVIAPALAMLLMSIAWFIRCRSCREFSADPMRFNRRQPGDTPQVQALRRFPRDGPAGFNPQPPPAGSAVPLLPPAFQARSPRSWRRAWPRRRRSSAPSRSSPPVPRGRCPYLKGGSRQLVACCQAALAMFVGLVVVLVPTCQRGDAWRIFPRTPQQRGAPDEYRCSP